MAKKRARRLKSVATELVKKAREAMLTSVQVFNNPQIEFKSELFIVTNIIGILQVVDYDSSGQRTPVQTATGESVRVSEAEISASERQVEGMTIPLNPIGGYPAYLRMRGISYAQLIIQEGERTVYIDARCSRPRF